MTVANFNFQSMIQPFWSVGKSSRWHASSRPPTLHIAHFIFEKLQSLTRCSELKRRPSNKLSSVTNRGAKNVADGNLLTKRDPTKPPNRGVKRAPGQQTGKRETLEPGQYFGIWEEMLAIQRTSGNVVVHSPMMMFHMWLSMLTAYSSYREIFLFILHIWYLKTGPRACLTM